MQLKLLGFFRRKPKEKERMNTAIVKMAGDRKFEIMSDTVQISDDEANKIVEIVCSELNKTLTHITGYTIARRIGEEISPDKICATSVNGGTDGKEWLIKLSNNPLEFTG